MSFYVTYPSTSVSSGPIQFYLDGSPVYVSEDTVTPANSKPLPVVITNPDGTQPTGLATSANQVLEIADLDAINTSTNEINAKTPALVGGSVPVVGPLTDTQLRATPVPVSGTVTANQGTANATPWNVAVSNFPATQPVSGTVAATQSGTWTTGRTWTLLNSTDSVNSVQSGAWNITNITGTVSLPTNAATEATLAAQSAKLPATLGPKTSANSLAVVLASDQTSIPVLATSVINTGTVTNITNLVSTAQTFTAPANAIGFKIQAPSTNTENIAFTIGATATIATGILMEPGRSEDFDTGSNISVIATNATTQRVTVLWKVKP